MALMADLRSLSRSKASMLDFCKKKSRNKSPAKVATITISKTVKPFLFMFVLVVVPGGIEPPTSGL